jgi:hypothetical protein
MTRTGKIGRLPEELQEQLNGRIGKKVPDPQLLDWLNSSPEVRAVLARDFAGQNITRRNLALWKKGGYQHWITEQNAFIRSVGNVLDAIAARAQQAETSSKMNKMSC